MAKDQRVLERRRAAAAEKARQEIASAEKTMRDADTVLAMDPDAAIRRATERAAQRARSRLDAAQERLRRAERTDEQVEEEQERLRERTQSAFCEWEYIDTGADVGTVVYRRQSAGGSVRATMPAHEDGRVIKIRVSGMDDAGLRAIADLLGSL